MEYFGFAASVLMGLSLGLVGGGGSILTVPILVYLFGVNPILATAYSLFIVGLTSLIGGFTYLKKQEVDLKTGFIFAAPSFLGVYFTRAYIVPNLPDPVFSLGQYSVSKPLFIMIVFALMMLLASVSMILPPKGTSEKSFSRPLQILLVATEGLVVGSVTGFVGAGGGFLIIPALVVLVGMPMKRAVGTSLFIIAIKSLLGFTGDLQSSQAFDWNLLILISVVSSAGLFIGMSFSKKVSEAALKKGFGFFVLIMGFFILLDQVRKLAGG